MCDAEALGKALLPQHHSKFKNKEAEDKEPPLPPPEAPPEEEEQDQEPDLGIPTVASKDPKPLPSAITVQKQQCLAYRPWGGLNRQICHICILVMFAHWFIDVHCTIFFWGGAF